MSKTCYFTDHDINWGGDCYTCTECGKVFVPKEGRKIKNTMGNGWYTSPHNKRFYATSLPYTIDGIKVSAREYYLEMVDATAI